MNFATLDDVTLHYRLFQGAGGKGSGRETIVFINSLGTDLRIWAPLLASLGDAFDWLVFDKRGHGLSGLGAAPHRIESYAADLAGLMEHLGTGSAIVCGLSIGGLIAQALYKARPDLVTGLILCDTAAKIGTAQSWNDRIAAIRADGIESIGAGVTEKWFTTDFHKTRPAELAGYRTMLERQPVEGYAAACEALREADYIADAARIAVPTLVAVGDQDDSTSPELVHAFAGSIPGARFEIIADAGHIPCVEQPAALAALMRAFIAGCRQSGG